MVTGRTAWKNGGSVGMNKSLSNGVLKSGTVVKINQFGWIDQSRFATLEGCTLFD